MGEVLIVPQPQEHRHDGTIELAFAELVARLEIAIAPFTGSGTGFPHEDARRGARWIARAEALDLPGFGVAMLARDLRSAALDRSAGLASESAAAEVRALSSIDASGVPGPLALARAVREAGASAAAHGIGAVALREVGALGVLGLAVRELALDGLVAVAVAQAPAAVAPWGGTAPVIGTNPIAFAAPRSAAAPLVVDFATSRATLAAVRAHAASGVALPAGVALDAEGRPTTDPGAASALLAEGRIASLAGLLVEVLAGAAAGGRGTGAHPVDGRGALLLALDPASTGGLHAADVGAELSAAWTASGGHLPARFDALPLDPADETGAVRVSAAALHELESASAGGAAA